MPERVTVLKLDTEGQVTWKYDGQVLERSDSFVRLEAFFDRDDMLFVETVLKRGDRFVEHFYSDRWYNIFEIYDRDDGKLKGWYCNIGHPALFGEGLVSYIDLAIDLWVTPDGKQSVLDEDEFIGLSLEVEIRQLALNALEEIKQAFANGIIPL